MWASAARAIALGTLLTAAGCLGPRPSPPRDAAIAPLPTWRHGEAGTPLAEERWWQSFGDPALDRLVEEALAHNSDIGISAARVAEARAQVRAARAERFPEIDLASGGDYSKTVTLGIPVTTPGGTTQAEISWDLDLFGRLAKADAAARASLLASRAAHDAVRLSIAASTAETYLRLLGADARLRIVQETLASRAESLRISRRLADAGYASQLQKYQAEGEYRSTQALVPQAELAVAKLEDALSILVGHAPGSVVRPEGGLDRVIDPTIPLGLPSGLLRRRPDIVAAEDRLVAVDHSLDSARAAMLPDVSLGGSVGETYAEVLPHPFTIFDIGGSILAPLLDAGRRRAAADAAAARRDQAAFSYRDTVLTAFREVEDAIATGRRTTEQRQAIVAQEQADAAALRLATRRAGAGYDSYLNQLDAQRQLLSAQLSLIDARTDELVASTQLYMALGGGWSAMPDYGGRGPSTSTTSIPSRRP